MVPFSTLFISPTANAAVNIFDINILIAIIVYSLAGWLAVRFVQFIYNRP
jgi:hypothetical protein